MTLAELLRHFEEISGFAVNLDPRHPAFFAAPSLQLAPDQYLHHSSSCRKYKFIDGNTRCAANKLRSIRIAALGRSFCGRCPRGIWEMAMPVIVDHELAAVIYLGGREGNPPDAERRDQLRAELRFAAHFIRLELQRYQLSGRDGGKKRDRNFYLASARRYLDLHYMGPVVLAELAETLRVNPNYLGGLLKSATGKNFHQLLNARRVEEAQNYLAWHQQLGIGEIGRRCGFADSNYFSVVFRNFTGMSPSEYRRRHGEAHL